MAEKTEGPQQIEQSPDIEAHHALGKKELDLGPEAAQLTGLRTVELGLAASQVITEVDKAEEGSKIQVAELVDLVQ